MDRNTRIEFGDFQTPEQLCDEVIKNFDDLKSYNTYIEPTCGDGYFLYGLKKVDIQKNKLSGWEINPAHVQFANQLLNQEDEFLDIVKEQDFFSIDWDEVNEKYDHPIFFIGNPPWVTNAELGKLLSKNLPQKQNMDSLSGFDAITGKSNFDISEWMLRKVIDFISGTDSGFSFLIKTSVARKLYIYIHDTKKKVKNISIKMIDTKKHFNVSVDGCLFSVHGCRTGSKSYKCSVHDDLSSSPGSVMGFLNKKIISDITKYEKYSHIDCGSEFKWRSGIKHDSSKVMEFDFVDGVLTNGLKEEVEFPFDYLYPMYKSSNISKDSLPDPGKYMLVTQQKIGEDTSVIRDTSPKTWAYLIEHESCLNGRKSSIYKDSNPFSIFGVGDYSFKKYKISISGLYKNLKFSKIDMFKGKPIVLDDTCYFLGFNTAELRDFVFEMLDSDVCSEFIKSIIFLDSKRPITVSLLNRISIKNISIYLDREDEFSSLFEKEPLKDGQLLLI